MTAESFSTLRELRRIIADGGISEDALEAVTGIQTEKLRSYLDEARLGTSGMSLEPQVLSGDESERLSTLAMQLTEGLRIGDDERLKAIYESLTIGCGLTVANIAKLTGFEVDDVDGVLRDPRTVSVEKRYTLAITGSYLINAVNQARGR